jgi:hypothetical protein
MSCFERYCRHYHGNEKGESQSSRHVWNSQEEGQTNATICGMGNTTGKKNDPVYYNEGADHPASDAGEKAGQKRISHKLKLESFKHFILSSEVWRFQYSGFSFYVFSLTPACHAIAQQSVGGTPDT